MNARAYSITIIVATMLTACSGGSSTNNTDSDSISADSVEAGIIPVMLPDTVFTSAEIVKSSVTVLQPEADSTLNTLTDLYKNAPGAFTFRFGPYRDASFRTHVKGVPDSIAIDWVFHTEEDYTPGDWGAWGGGTGWTGQPVRVTWPDSCLSRIRQAGVLMQVFSGDEIIFGSLVGKVYFLDTKSGKPSREPINAGNPIKGSVSLDPTFNGNLYVGHGIPSTTPFGAITINLFNNTITHVFPKDSEAWRGWQAYDSSPLRVAQFLFRPGENGTLYKFSVSPSGALTLHSTLRYRIGGAAPGIESSMAAYRNYGYLTDNHGNVLCVNLNNLRPVWHYALGDDTDGSPVLCVEDNHPYVYAACEIDRQAERDSLGFVEGTAKMAKLDALTGAQVWRAEVPGFSRSDGGKHFDGGFYATSLPGTGNCEHLIFANCVLNTENKANGQLMAFSRKDGSVMWTTKLRAYAWSSPVAFVNETGRMFIFTADCSGTAYVLDGATGRIITRRRVGSNFESSPVAFGNSLVVGSRGNSIYKLSLISHE